MDWILCYLYTAPIFSFVKFDTVMRINASLTPPIYNTRLLGVQKLNGRPGVSIRSFTVCLTCDQVVDRERSSFFPQSQARREKKSINSVPSSSLLRCFLETDQRLLSDQCMLDSGSA